ncbi:hypothetical protein [Acinetobacter bereziniae]|uniref:hypothetical protein n=1 Tax=Acinetobacter bereziniae TaxID=106648 RepID=UPI0032B32C7D
MQKEMLALTASLSTEFTMHATNVQRLLVSSLVAHLIEKNIVNREEYIEHTLEVKDYLLLNRTFEVDRERLLLEATFDLHINDIKDNEES